MGSDSLYHNLVPIKFAPTLFMGFWGRNCNCKHYLTHIILSVTWDVLLVLGGDYSEGICQQRKWPKLINAAFERWNDVFLYHLRQYTLLYRGNSIESHFSVTYELSLTE